MRPYLDSGHSTIYDPAPVFAKKWSTGQRELAELRELPRSSSVLGKRSGRRRIKLTSQRQTLATKSTSIGQQPYIEAVCLPPDLSCGSSVDEKGEADRDLSTIPDSECSEMMGLGDTPDPPLQQLGKKLDYTTNAQILVELEDLRTELRKEKACVFTLRCRLSETQIEIDELHNSSQAADAGQYDLRKQISYLFGQLEAKDRLWQDTVAFRADTFSFSREAIIREYNLVYYEINEVSSFICEMSPDGEDFSQQKSHYQQTAHTWAVKASGRKLERLLSYSHEERIPKEKLFASLVTAGVFELVFKPVFPDILALESSLLYQYRKHIETKSKRTLISSKLKTNPSISGGQQALHELDLMALKSLTSEEHFTSEVLPEKAKSLAAFIMWILQLSLPLESQDIDRRCQQEISGAGSLETVLAQALHLKVRFALSKGCFRFYFFKPGDPYNTRSMDLDTSCTAGSGNGRHCSQDSVKLCLFPALYFLPQEEGRGAPEYLEMNLASTRTDCLAEARQEDLELLDIVAKGVVLI
ncbi:hypothetical protein EDB81DRAFT_763355 [Dactylonectria macrodidyma]|uniref:Uncharacterized protein n=1 Tax=Dactylonectria macrodidyma TaxID=307937 RepID=A0A9P9E7H9_9HYPO|nr:hypothetical protein EDB81DRAFT_763355 [Dactylonectria macrodidyma]